VRTQRFNEFGATPSYDFGSVSFTSILAVLHLFLTCCVALALMRATSQVGMFNARKRVEAETQAHELAVQYARNTGDCQRSLLHDLRACLSA